MREQLHSALKKYFRVKLLLVREESGLSQEKMAHELGMSTKALCNLEDGVSCPSLTTFIFLCFKFTLDLNEIFTGLADAFEEAEKQDQ